MLAATVRDPESPSAEMHPRPPPRPIPAGSARPPRKPEITVDGDRVLVIADFTPRADAWHERPSRRWVTGVGGAAFGGSRSRRRGRGRRDGLDASRQFL